MTRFIASTSAQWNAAEHWLTTTVPGLIILAVLGTLATKLLVKLAKKLWHALDWAKRVTKLLESYARPFVLARLLTHRYIKKKDYFGFVAHTVFAATGLIMSTIIDAVLVALVCVYFGLHGIHFSWTLLVLLSLTGFFLLGWFRDAFYFYGVWEQTFLKDWKTYKKILKKTPMSLSSDLMTKDIDTVLNPKEKTIQSKPPESIEDKGK
jgi:hypothetical protein